MKRALQIIVVIGVAGLAFSGILVYREFFGHVVEGKCSALGAPGSVFGYPPCIYGFIMYLAVVTVATAGLVGRRSEQHPSVDRPDPVGKRQ